ncbi:hypothetical protein [Xanthomonas arboricola]
MDADSLRHLDAINSLGGRGRGALAAPDSLLAVLLQAMRTNQLDWSLPVHRRGTLRGMDAA